MKVAPYTLVYEIDLSLPESKRWSHVIAAEKKDTRALMKEASAQLEALPIPKGLIKAAMAAFKVGYKFSGGRYLAEMEAWASAMGMPVNEVLVMQCTYEISHAYEQFPNLGCSSGIFYTKKLGMCHVRNMDWALATLGQATRLYTFRNGNRKFHVVGVLGLVGALSGMLPKAYSVTINYAPASKIPGFDFGPLFLLREVLETCDTYTDAVAMLRDMPLSSNVFFSVCGSKSGQACVIERTRKDAAIRRFRGTPLCQTNHFNTRKFAKDNAPAKAEYEDYTTLYEDSRDRHFCLKNQLADLPKSSSLEHAASVLDIEPVFNEDTCQQMVFCPAKGSMEVWRYV